MAKTAYIKKILSFSGNFFEIIPQFRNSACFEKMYSEISNTKAMNLLEAGTIFCVVLVTTSNFNIHGLFLK